MFSNLKRRMMPEIFQTEDEDSNELTVVRILY